MAPGSFILRDLGLNLWAHMMSNQMGPTGPLLQICHVVDPSVDRLHVVKKVVPTHRVTKCVLGWVFFGPAHFV